MRCSAHEANAALRTWHAQSASTLAPLREWKRRAAVLVALRAHDFLGTTTGVWRTCHRRLTRSKSARKRKFEQMPTSPPWRWPIGRHSLVYAVAGALSVSAVVVVLNVSGVFGADADFLPPVDRSSRPGGPMAGSCTRSRMLRPTGRGQEGGSAVCREASEPMHVQGALQFRRPLPR